MIASSPKRLGATVARTLARGLRRREALAADGHGSVQAAGELGPSHQGSQVEIARRHLHVEALRRRRHRADRARRPGCRRRGGVEGDDAAIDRARDRERGEGGGSQPRRPEVDGEARDLGRGRGDRQADVSGEVARGDPRAEDTAEIDPGERRAQLARWRRAGRVDASRELDYADVAFGLAGADPSFARSSPRAARARGASHGNR